jgi:predicted transcriptional regulator
MQQPHFSVNTFSLINENRRSTMRRMAGTKFPSIEEIERRRKRAKISILALCKEADLAAWSYHRHLNGRGGSPRLSTLQALYDALERLKPRKKSAA